MPKKLFEQVDPYLLDRYTKKSIPRRRRIPQKKIEQLSLLRRALQSLPPRELQMMFMVKIRGVGQEETRRMFHVRQSNVSYRLERSRDRITLHHLIYSIFSETQFRRYLLDKGFTGETVQAILGVIRTTSQSATAKALGMSPGSIRHIFSSAIEKLMNEDPGSQELALLELIERNYNQLRPIRTQSRWLWKKSNGAGDLPRDSASSAKSATFQVPPAPHYNTVVVNAT